MLKNVTWKNSRLIPAFDPREIEAMKTQPGKDMIVFGSGSLVSQLTKHDLIDEYRFVISPTLLGDGQDVAQECREDLEAQADRLQKAIRRQHDPDLRPSGLDIEPIRRSRPSAGRTKELSAG
jgi:dihydrofolate reductase